MSLQKRSKSGSLISKKRSESVGNIKIFAKSHVPESENDCVTEVNADSDELFQCSVDNNVDEMGVDVPSWREGRRIVELGYLADKCTECSENLFLSNISREVRYGYGSLLIYRLYMQCF
jgi:hypothetical protein